MTISLILRNGASYFVNGAVGSDGYDGSRNNPFATIGRAIMQAHQDSGPNRVIIAPGTYNENLTINDFGGLLMRGEGNSPHDVVVNGNNLGTSLSITGGSEIELQNMSFKHGTNGIDAENLSSLELRNVRVRNNSNYGLTANNIDDVYITQSNFLYNGFSGARIAESNSVDVNRSLFSYNAENGLGLDGNSKVNVFSVTAIENGLDDEESGPRADAGQVDNGLAAFLNDQLEIRSSTFMNNLRDGLDLQSNRDVSLLHVTAMANRQNGASGDGNQYVLVRNGKYNGNISGDGINLQSFGVIAASGESGEGQDGDATVRVVGGRFWDNGEDGFSLNGYDEATLISLNAQRNGYDGVHVRGTGSAWLNHIRTTNNGDDGTEVGFARNVKVDHLNSASNQYAGLFVLGDASTEMVNINHGNYHQNGGDGILVYGDDESRLNRANIRYANSTENEGSGLYISDTNYGAIVGGMFSNNGYDGVDLFDTGRFSLDNVKAEANHGDGLFSGANLFDLPGSGIGSDYTLRGSLDITRGSFSNNQANGIWIEGMSVVSQDVGRQGGEGADIIITVDMDRVVAEKNLGNGVFFGEGPIIYDPPESFGDEPIARETGYATNVRFEANFNRGSFRTNGEDGIRAEVQYGFLGGLDVNLDADIQVTRINASDNGGNGFYSDFSLLNVPYPVPFFDGTGSTGTSGNVSNVRYYFDHGSFIRNGGDGISVLGPNALRSIIISSTARDGEDPRPEFYADGVSATRNGGTGLSFYTGRIVGFDPPVPVPTPTTGGEGNGGYPSELVARIYNGEFNDNGEDGIDINIVTDQPYDGEFGSQVVVEKVIAKRNGFNGLNMAGVEFIFDDDEGFSQPGINANIIRGVFNRNEQDGIHLSNLGDVYLENPTGVANRDDGFEGTNIANVSGDWTFVDNGDQDFIWN